MTPLLADGRATLLATAPMVWLGVALLPDVHSSLKLPAWLALAALVGVGGELSARLVAPEAAWRRGWGTFWFVPAGAALLAVVWFSVLPDRPRNLAPLVVIAVLGTMLVQRVEVAGPQSLRAGAHAISIGLAFAVAFVVYATSAHLRAPWTLAVVLAATAFAALILLRDIRTSRRRAALVAAVIAFVVTELAFVLAGGSAPAWACAALLVLALYASSGASHAALEGAPRHVYAELALVTGVGLAAIVVGAARI